MQLFEVERSPHLDALEKAHRSNLIDAKRKLALFSADIDKQTQKLAPNSNRWDYLVWFKTAKKLENEVMALEVHSAYDSQVSTVIKKKEWAEIFLREETDIKVNRWVWAASGKISILKTSRFARNLAKNGIEFPVKIVK
jgi:hypothetical protein